MPLFTLVLKKSRIRQGKLSKRRRFPTNIARCVPFGLRPFQPWNIPKDGKGEIGTERHRKIHSHRIWWIKPPLPLNTTSWEVQQMRHRIYWNDHNLEEESTSLDPPSSYCEILFFRFFLKKTAKICKRFCEGVFSPAWTWLVCRRCPQSSKREEELPYQGNQATKDQETDIIRITRKVVLLRLAVVLRRQVVRKLLALVQIHLKPKQLARKRLQWWEMWTIRSKIMEEAVRCWMKWSFRLGKSWSVSMNICTRRVRWDWRLQRMERVCSDQCRKRYFQSNRCTTRFVVLHAALLALQNYWTSEGRKLTETFFKLLELPGSRGLCGLFVESRRWLLVFYRY